MVIAVTICSKHKDENTELLPARERYISEHIKKTEAIAEETGLPFYILSGKHGLLAAHEPVSNYDQYLELDAVDDLVVIVESQLRKLGVTEVDFYMEDKESWILYAATLKKATDLTGATLRVHQLP